MTFPLNLAIVPISAILYRQRGYGMPRLLYLAIMLAFTYGLSHSILFIACFSWVLFVIACSPTQDLFSAMHGYYPTRDDSLPWKYLQIASMDIANWIALYINMSEFTKARIYGTVYGTFRGLVAALPVILWTPWALIFLANGLVYNLSGNGKWAVVIAEMTMGTLLGIYILTLA